MLDGKSSYAKYSETEINILSLQTYLIKLYSELIDKQLRDELKNG